jgi:hypothetical protein
MRKRLLDKAEALDGDANTPADYAVMGKGMEFRDYAPMAIEGQLKDYFKGRFNI